MNKNNSTIKDTAMLLMGELLVALLVIGGYSIAKFGFSIDVGLGRVISGCALGVLITVLNFFFLSLSVNRALDGYLEMRGSSDMTDEEAAAFTAKHSMQIQNTVKVSFIIRTATMGVALAVAFITGWFDPLATAIVLLAFRPVLTFSELLRRKGDKKPNPENFVRYDDGEKESDDFGA